MIINLDDSGLRDFAYFSVISRTKFAELQFAQNRAFLLRGILDLKSRNPGEFTITAKTTCSYLFVL